MTDGVGAMAKAMLEPYEQEAMDGIAREIERAAEAAAPA